jgi:ferric-dicitrate binding protein FerR (iron transport regulator)
MSQKYIYNSVDELLSDRTFQKWVWEGENHEEWVEWTLDNPQRAKLVDDARLILLAMKKKEDMMSDKDAQSSLHETWDKIHKMSAAKSDSGIKRYINLRRILPYAAVLALGVMAYLLAFYDPKTANPTSLAEDHKSDANSGLIEQKNNTKFPQLITLSDGSSILIQPNSKLSYPKTFNGSVREVYLTGEGFFEISKNPARPFIVYSNEVITRVYGTSFRISAYQDQPNVEVVVRTGKVELSTGKKMENSKNDKIILTPKQAAIYSRKEQVFEKIQNVSKENHVLTNPSIPIELLNFEFEDASVIKIFETIEKAYSISIDYPEDILKGCFLTTSLTDEPLTEKIKIVCESLGSRTKYEITGNQIKILTRGCK